VISLLKTARQTQSEALNFLVPGLVLHVQTLDGYINWTAMMFRDDKYRTIPFTACCGCNHDNWPVELCSSSFIWRQSLLIQCFNFLTLSVDLDRYSFLDVTISFRGEKGVHMCLREHGMRDDTYLSGEECTSAEPLPINTKQLNNVTMDKLKTKLEARLQVSDSCSRDLVLYVMRELSNVGCHTYHRRKNANGDWEFNEHISSKSFNGWKGEDWQPTWKQEHGIWNRMPLTFVDGMVLLLQD
jgi:hypothetical protein